MCTSLVSTISCKWFYLFKKKKYLVQIKNYFTYIIKYDTKENEILKFVLECYSEMLVIYILGYK